MAENLAVSIEYCTEWNYLPDAASLQSAIRDRFGIAAQLLEGSGGAFEVQVNGTLVFSKLKQFRFPENDEILDILSTMSSV